MFRLTLFLRYGALLVESDLFFVTHSYFELVLCMTTLDFYDNLWPHELLTHFRKIISKRPCAFIVLCLNPVNPNVACDRH